MKFLKLFILGTIIYSAFFHIIFGIAASIICNIVELVEFIQFISPYIFILSIITSFFASLEIRGNENENYRN